MEPIFELVREHAGHRIERRRPGFEFTPMLLGKIASFVVSSGQPDPHIFAFMHPLLGAPLDERALLLAAEHLIVAEIDGGRSGAGRDRTFEWRDGGWSEVTDPPWWVRVR